MLAPGSSALVGPALRRYWRSALLATAVVGVPLVALLARFPVRAYSMTGVYIVSSGQSASAPAYVTDNTDRAARDYAAELTQNSKLVTAVAADMRLRPNTLVNRVTSRYDPGTSTIFVRYQGASPAEVRAFFAALNGAFGNSTPNAAFAGAALRPLRVDGHVHKAAFLVPEYPAVGLIGGLAVGAAIAITRERCNPRVGTKTDLRGYSSAAVVEIRTAADIETLLRGLLRETAAREICVLPALPGDGAVARALGGSLRARVSGSPITVSTPTGMADAVPSSDDTKYVLAVRPDDPLRQVVDVLSACPADTRLALCVGAAQTLSPDGPLVSGAVGA
jgi:hypothetical protein